MNPTYQSRKHEAERKDIFPRTKIQHTNTINVPINNTSTCIMQHNDKFHGISHGSQIRRNIWKLPESNIHENVPIRNGPPTTTNTGGNRQYSIKYNCQWNGKIKNIQSNRQEILLDQRQNTKKHSHIFWEEGKKNLLDYVTNHYPIWYHRTVRPRYLKLKLKT